MWNHNNHFHNYLLDKFPQKINSVLDVGCGLGEFAKKLASRAAVVDAIDADIATIEIAQNQSILGNINYRYGNFLDLDFAENSYDLIVAIASIHHMDLEAALLKMKSLLRPSGKLLILGLYREANFLDYLYSFISVPLNWLYLNWHGKSKLLAIKKFAPTRPSTLSFSQINSIAKRLIPGCQIKRHLFWRYSLIWQKNS